MPSPIEAFCAYADKDQQLWHEFKIHLNVLQRLGLINIWSYVDINPGANWEEEMDRHLKTAQIILLLISPDFIASDYYYGKLMKQAMQRHGKGEATVLPIILRPVHWKSTPLSKLQALPTNGRPISDSSWSSLDAAFFNVVEGVQRATEQLTLNLSDNTSVITEVAPKPIQLKPRNYIYISDRKVNMFYSQIPQNIIYQLATSLEINPEYLQGKTQGSEQEATRYSKTRIVSEYINRFLEVGTIDAPKAYFAGVISAKCIINDYEVFFGGSESRNSMPGSLIYVGLSGSTKHLIGQEYQNSHPGEPQDKYVGRVKAQVFNLNSNTVGFSRLLNRTRLGEEVHSLLILRERTNTLMPRRRLNPLAIFGRRSSDTQNPESQEQNILTAVRAVTRKIHAPNQQYEFLARTLLSGPPADVNFWDRDESPETYIFASQLARVLNLPPVEDRDLALLGTPIYVALTNS